MNYYQLSYFFSTKDYGKRYISTSIDANDYVGKEFFLFELYKRGCIDKIECFFTIKIQVITKEEYKASNSKMYRRTYRYVSYENEIKGRYTERKMFYLYSNSVDKKEYPTYRSWKADMLKSGIFEKL